MPRKDEETSKWSFLWVPLVIVAVSLHFYLHQKGYTSPAHSTNTELQSHHKVQSNSIVDWIKSHSVDYLTLLTRRWRATPPAKGIVFLVHGFGEHSGRYEHIASRLSSEGFEVFALDHQGHGLSEGDRVHVSDMEDYISDLMHFVNVTRDHLAEEWDKDIDSLPPLFLVGHSMGGTITLATAMKHPSLWNGVVVSGPALEVPSLPLQLLANVLGNLYPKLTVPGLLIDREGLSKSVENRLDYNADPLVYHGDMRAGWGKTIIDKMNHLMDSAHTVSFPLLILHGEDDTICPITSSEEYVSRIPESHDKSLIRFKELRHEIFREDEKDEVIDAVLEWIQSRL